MLLDCEVNDLTKPKLTVIEGGIPYLLKTRKKNLINAYVTDTRLMGVLAIYAHWSIGENNDIRDLHQFFYIDCEESGFETYQSIEGNDREEIDMAEQTIVGGLGANKIEITERQLRAVLYRYSIFNEEKDLTLPEKLSEYSFILESKTVLDPLEDAALMNIICGSITSDYQVINYFMMRCIGQDEPGIRYLSDDIALKNPYSGYNCATFCKNVIDKDGQYGDGSSSYMCESLIEENGEYETVISRISIKNLKVTAVEKCSGFHVSSAEAAMMLSKPEFVTVYEVLLSDEDMENNIGELTINFNTIMSVQENGRLFMAFKQNNDHVNNRIFRLSNDVKGIYFLTDYGQLIVAAYTLSDIRYLENKLKASPLAPFLMVTSKYEFKEPVLFEFMQSDFEDFDDFLNYIKDE